MEMWTVPFLFTTSALLSSRSFTETVNLKKPLHWQSTAVMIRIARLPRWALFWELCMEKRFSGEKWLGYCGEEIITGCVNLHYDILTIDKLSRVTCNFGIETDLQECGKEQADSFRMDYVGLPEIGPAKTAEIRVKLPQFLAGEENKLVWDLPDGLKMDKSGVEKKEKGTEYYYTVRMDETVGCLSDHYILKASLKDPGGKTIRIQNIGLAGVQPFRILGPFWDMFDWKKVSEEERITKKCIFRFPNIKSFVIYLWQRLITILPFLTGNIYRRF